MLRGRIKSVVNKAEYTKPLKVGDSIPNGKLVTMEGKIVRLWEEVWKKPTVLIFYRGGWCPSCSAQLGQLAKVEQRLRDRGIQLLAISPDRPEKLRENAVNQQLDLTLLSDSSMKLCRAFGIAYRLSENGTETVKNKYHTVLENASGDNHHLLPVPAAYVVDRYGKIHFAYANPDHKERVNLDDLMRAAEKLPYRL